MKPISGYISAQEGIRIEITHAYENTLKPRLYMPNKHSSHLFSNWLIGQLNHLAAISQPKEALELKSLFVFNFLKIILTEKLWHHILKTHCDIIYHFKWVKLLLQTNFVPDKMSQVDHNLMSWHLIETW